MQEIKRKDAVRLLEKIAEQVAEWKNTPNGVAPAAVLERMFKEAGLDLPRPCTGEAHSNAHIDNCGVCMPRWGWVFTGKGYHIP